MQGRAEFDALVIDEQTPLSPVQQIVVATIAFARDVAGRTDFQGALE